MGLAKGKRRTSGIRPAITDKLKIVNPWNDPSYVNYGTTFDMTFDDYVAKFGTITVESRIGINATK